MHAATKVVPSSRLVWTGRIFSGFVVLFLLFDAVIKLMRIPEVTETFRQLGYPESLALAFGIIELICVVLYAVPQTAMLGAILLTALLGGGMAAHIRVDNPLFSHTLFGVYVGLLTWGGLYFRDAKLRELIPFRRQ